MLQVFRHKYISSPPQPRHAHAETTITMVLAGTIRERVGNAEEIARPFSYVIKPWVETFDASKNQLRMELFGNGEVVNVGMANGRADALKMMDVEFKRQ